MAYRQLSLAEVGLNGRCAMACWTTIFEGRWRPVNYIPWLVKPQVKCQKACGGTRSLVSLNCGCSKTEIDHCLGGQQGRRLSAMVGNCELDANVGWELDCHLSQRLVHMVLA